MPEEFYTQMETALQKACELLGADSGTIVIEEISSYKTEGYGRYVKFGDKQFRIRLTQSEQHTTLLYTFVDVIVDKLKQIAQYLATPRGRFFHSRSLVFCEVEEWIKNIYFKNFQDEIIMRYRVGLGLELDLIDLLSMQPYEKERCEGGIAFVEDPKRDVAPFLSVQIQSEEEILFSAEKLKVIRKLLAGAGKDGYLLFQRSEENNNRYLCKGYCSERRARQLGWSARILNVRKWDFYYKEQPLFRFLNGDPKIIRNDIEDVVKQLKGEFSGGFDEKAAYLMLEAAAKQTHGTTLIFMDLEDSVSSGWVQRLYDFNRAVGIELSASSCPACVIEELSRMDGAILVDMNTMSMRYAATIVDGRAMVSGSLGRGARHNGVKTFISDLVKSDPAENTRIAAAIFSEDGGVTTVCGQEIRKKCTKFSKSS